MKSININVEYFDVIRSDQKARKYIEIATNNWGNNLYAFYNSPSEIKERIYEDWRIWVSQTDCVNRFGVCSANTCVFCLSFIFVDGMTGEVLGAGHITPSYNRLYVYSNADIVDGGYYG